MDPRAPVSIMKMYSPRRESSVMSHLVTAFGRSATGKSHHLRRVRQRWDEPSQGGLRMDMRRAQGVCALVARAVEGVDADSGHLQRGFESQGRLSDDVHVPRWKCC